MNIHPTKVLVTGGAGYIGSILVPALLGDGYDVTVVDNFLFGQASLNHLCANPHFDVVRGDVRNVDVMRPLLAKADVIIPLAAIVGAPACEADQIAAATTNTGAIAALTEFMSADQRVLIPITNSGYGVGEPGRECTEETPMRPISLYGMTKTKAEEIVMERGNAVSLRLATVFGMSPRMRLDLLVNDFVYRAVNDLAVVLFEPHFTRNYIHVRDVASAFIHALDRFEAMKNQTYNVGLSDANMSKLELCQRIKTIVPDFEITFATVGKDPDKRDYVVSNAKIEATGFKPCYSLDAGIGELVKGYQMIRNRRYGNA